MATNPLQGTAPRASSILSQALIAITQGQKAVPAGAPTSVSTRGWMKLRRVFFTVSDVSDPKRLYDVINRLQESILSVLGVVSTNQMIPGNILRAVPFTAGQSRMLVHGLNRPWQGYFCVRAQLGSGVPLFADTAYVAGTTADKILPLNSTNAGTYDIYVF